MDEEEEETNSLRDLIQNLTANMESNFAKLHIMWPETGNEGRN